MTTTHPSTRKIVNIADVARQLTLTPKFLAAFWSRTWRAPTPPRLGQGKYQRIHSSGAKKVTFYLSALDNALLEELVTWFWRETGGPQNGKSMMVTTAIQTMWLDVLTEGAMERGYSRETAREIAETALSQRYEELRTQVEAQAHAPQPVRWFNDPSRLSYQRVAE